MQRAGVQFDDRGQVGNKNALGIVSCLLKCNKYGYVFALRPRDFLIAMCYYFSMNNQTKTCPHCMSEVHKKASRCPHCHGKLYVWTWARIGIAVILIYFFLTFMFSDTPAADPAAEMASYKVRTARDIARACAEAVVLKSPSTAEYERPAAIPDPETTNGYLVRSYVDSQNAFGATTRAYWSMKLRYTGVDNISEVDAGNNWKIDEFTFEGTPITCIR